MQYWPAIVFGWPSFILGLFLLGAGVFRKRKWLALSGAILASPLCTYIALNPPPARWIGLTAITVLFTLAIRTWRTS